MDSSAVARSATSMPEALAAPRANEALAAKLQLYGRFVGSWTVDIDHLGLGGPRRRAEGEWHFGWALDGKAIQDVWIFPARHLRGAAPEPWYRFGTTLRWYDPAIDAWHILYLEPGHCFELHQLGRAQGEEIVQLGEHASGLLRRWRFVEITKDSFRWLGEASWDKGGRWALELEMRARRIAA